MSLTQIAASVCLLFRFACSAAEQSVNEIMDTLKPQVSPSKLSEIAVPVSSKFTLLGPANKPSCSAIPTSVTRTSNLSYTLSKATAGKLGVTFALTGNASFDQKSKVFVREVKRFATCDSTDGTAILQYGSVWRATVLVDEAAAAASVNFAVVAASATLANLAVQVKIETINIADAEVQKLTAAAMQATASGLNVVTFTKFSEAAESAASRAQTIAISGPLELIGIVPVDTVELTNSIAATVALHYITQGRGCLDPIKDFKTKGAEVERIIRETYETICGSCAVTDDDQKRRASKLLNNVQLKLN